MIFNLYSEEIFAEALSESQEGITINGEVISNIWYTDETVLLADSAASIQIPSGWVNERWIII